MLRPIESRPKTKLLKQPTPNLTLPIIDYVDKYRRKHQLCAAEASELLVVGRLRLAGISTGSSSLDAFKSIQSAKQTLSTQLPNNNNAKSSSSSLAITDESIKTTNKSLLVTSSSAPTTLTSNTTNALQTTPTLRQRAPNQKPVVTTTPATVNTNTSIKSACIPEIPLQQIQLTCYICKELLPADALLQHVQNCQQEVSTLFLFFFVFKQTDDFLFLSFVSIRIEEYELPMKDN